MSRRTVLILVAAAGAALVVLGVVLLGLDRADQLASVGSLIVGAVALGLSVITLRRPEAARRRAHGTVRGTKVAGTAIGVAADTSYDDVVGVVDVGEVAEGGTVIGATVRDDDRPGASR